MTSANQRIDIRASTRTVTTFVLCLLPAFALAEGSVRVFTCEATKHCDAAGQCEALSEAVQFHLEPQALNDDGSGEYLLLYRDIEVPMQAFSEAGPFVWQQDDERHTLLVSSQSEFLWHVLSLAAEPAASIRFLRCSVTL